MKPSPNPAMRQTIRNSLKSHRNLLDSLPLPRDVVSRGWAVIFSATMARMGFSFLTGLLIGRTFGPEAFGGYSLLTAAAGIVRVVVDFGLTEAAAWPGQGSMILGVLPAPLLSAYLLQLPDNGLLLSLALVG